jgi:hypothetical protein
LIVAVVALLLILAAPLALFFVRNRVRFYRNRKAFAARQAKARRSAGLRFIARKRPTTIVSNDPDSKVALKSEYPTSLQDEKNLRGRTLWVDAGGQLDYYRYTGHSIDFSHSEGVLLGAEKIQVKDAVQEPVPESVAFPIPRGDAQILLIFTLPNDPSGADKEFAVAVGNKEGGVYNLLTDQIMFYDDPHTLYAYWGPQIWKAIDEHRVILGMTERQVRLALGEVSTPRGNIMGDRQVEYDNLGHPMLITFGNSLKGTAQGTDRVTKIVDETQ